MQCLCHWCGFCPLILISQWLVVDVWTRLTLMDLNTHENHENPYRIDANSNWYSIFQNQGVPFWCHIVLLCLVVPRLGLSCFVFWLNLSINITCHVQILYSRRTLCNPNATGELKIRSIYENIFTTQHTTGRDNTRRSDASARRDQMDDL